jgi:hypothetical protein
VSGRQVSSVIGHSRQVMNHPVIQKGFLNIEDGEVSQDYRSVDSVISRETQPIFMPESFDANRSLENMFLSSQER